MRGPLAVVIALALVALSAAGAPPVRAKLPAPGWMPNAPIMAGPQVILLWMPVPGAVKYNVYVNDKKVAEAVGVQHMIATPEEAGEYNIRISGVDAAGVEGAKSPPGVVRIVLIEPPKGIVAREAQGKGKPYVPIIAPQFPDLWAAPGRDLYRARGVDRGLMPPAYCSVN